MSAMIVTQVEGPCAGVVFNRPEALNAVNAEWLDELHAALDQLESCYGLRLAVFTGSGNAFSTGLDLDALHAGQITLGWFCRWQEALGRIEKLSAVTLARIRGCALGGGLQLALACDLRLASEDARLGFPLEHNGTLPGLGTDRLPQFIGLGRARRMILCGEVVDAARALEIGLVDWVAKEEDLDAQAERIAAQVLAGSRTAQLLAKKLGTVMLEAGAREFHEAWLAYVAQALESGDKG